MSDHWSFSTPAIIEQGERTTVDQIVFSGVLDSLPEVAVEVVASLAMMRGGAQRLVDRPACEESQLWSTAKNSRTKKKVVSFHT